jgi:hypothetical protein
MVSMSKDDATGIKLTLKAMAEDVTDKCRKTGKHAFIVAKMCDGNGGYTHEIRVEVKPL